MRYSSRIHKTIKKKATDVTGLWFLTTNTENDRAKFSSAFTLRSQQDEREILND